MTRISRAQLMRLHGSLCSLLHCEDAELQLTATPEGLVMLSCRPNASNSLTRLGSPDELLGWARTQGAKSARRKRKTTPH